MPTLLAWAGAEIDLPGKDLSPLLTDPAASVRDAVLFTYGG